LILITSSLRPAERSVNDRLVRGGATLRAPLLASLLAGVLMLAPAFPAAGQTEDSAAEGEEGEPEALRVPSRTPGDPPRGRDDSRGEGPGIDSLLQLPNGFMSERSRPVAGAGESEWRRRFERSVGELAAAKRKLDKTKSELDEVAESGGANQWSVAPPGGGGGGGSSPASSPLSFKLRQQLKDDRDAVEQAERALRELRIEADLAGVPQSWRGSDGKAGQARRN